MRFPKNHSRLISRYQNKSTGLSLTLSATWVDYMLMLMCWYWQSVICVSGKYNFFLAIKTEIVYGLRGGTVELPVEQLPEGTKVTSIIWKHGKDKVAEWFEEDGEDVTYFGQFYSSTALNKKTWGLNISDLQPSHTGNYWTELNNKDPTKAIHLIILSKLWKIS